MPSSDHYHLPSSDVQRCMDRFSILPDSGDIEDDNGEVSAWEIIKELLLTTSIISGNQLTDLLETIALTLKGSTGPAGDYGLLKEVIADEHASFLTECWADIVRIALSMPQLFPDGSLPVLGTFETEASPGISESTLRFSREQVACLVVHQFLGTLSAPVPRRTDYYDFSIWYNSRQRHESAARIYLNTLLRYLATIAKEQDRARRDGPVMFTLRHSEVPHQTNEDETSHNFRLASSSGSHPLCAVQICQVEEYDTNAQSLGLPNGAAVVSANRVIGFGESATQEEIHVGCSPEACPAVLIVPELRNNEVLVVRGAEAISNIVGQRRQIHLGRHDPVIGYQDWTNRTMLFMDALELDDPEQYRGDSLDIALPDLAPRNMEREVHKAQIAFSSGTYEAIISPLWGCGAFGGDPFVKTLLLWCAASLAWTSRGDERLNGEQSVFTLRIVCDKTLADVAETLNEIVQNGQTKLDTVDSLRDLLSNIPKEVKKFETGSWLLQRLQAL